MWVLHTIAKCWIHNDISILGFKKKNSGKSYWTVILKKLKLYFVTHSLSQQQQTNKAPYVVTPNI